MSKPDAGGKRALLSRSGIDMNAVSCEPIPYYIYTPFPFSLRKVDKRRFKFRLSESEFEKFKNKYHHLLKDWSDGRDGDAGESEYIHIKPYRPRLAASYEYSSSRRIIVYYVPSLSEIKFVVFDH